MPFLRPKRVHAPPTWQKPAPATAETGAEPPPPHAQWAGTIGALFGLLVTAFTLSGGHSSSLARYAAIGTGISLAASVLIDLRGGARNLIRADVMAIAAFYFLTFFEFLFPQEMFDQMLEPAATRTGVHTVLIGFAGLLIGRHLLRPKQRPLVRILQHEVPPGWLIAILWVSCFIGYAHMALAVNFDLVDMVLWMMEPRFSQPWTRGRFGDWKALIVELGLFIYLLPPLAGIALARRNRFSFLQLAGVVAVLALTLFYGFTSGTRNVFASYLVTFIIGYAFALPQDRWKELVVLSAGGMILLMVATVMMLRFRNIGFNNWLAGSERESRVSVENSVFVDYNLCVIGRLTEVFPSHAAYLGWQVPYLALIRPIPRAVWPGKPEGLTASIENAVGANVGVSVAASFAGEAYMAGGWFAVFVAGLFFGGLNGWWSHLASPRNSELGILIYSSGFFAAVISMRSLFVFTTALLPTVAALVVTTMALRHIAARTRLWLTRAARTPRRPPPRR